MTPRRAVPRLAINGRDVTRDIEGYLTGLKFEDVDSGSSDSMSVELHDVDGKWGGSWYPTKGDSLQGAILFEDWDGPGKSHRLSFGTFILDEIRMGGSPSTAEFGALSIPSDSSFKTRQRTQTWEAVTVSKIASEICSRYGLALEFLADDVSVESIEQTKKTDSDFLYSLAKDYDLKMKVFNRKIFLFDGGRLEAKAPVATLTPSDFVDGAWDFVDSLEGTYTGAIVGYKGGDGKDEITVSVGRADEGSPKCRVLYVNAKCDSEGEAIRKGKAQVNLANEEATTLKGSVWPSPKLVSGATVTISGFPAHVNGKYYIEKSTLSLGRSGTKQKLQLHKVYGRL